MRVQTVFIVRIMRVRPWWAGIGLIVAVAALLAAACGPEEPRALVLATHDSFDIGEDIIAAFEAENDATVSIIKAGDAGEALTKAILTRDAPTADLLYGVDNTFLGRALDADIFVPYTSPRLETVPEEYRLDPTGHVMPVDYGFVALNYDAQWLDERGMEPPASLVELTERQWRGRLVVQNPATSSPGLAFLLTTIAVFGESSGYTWMDFWEGLIANDVLIQNGWSDSYYTSFSLNGGDRPLVVSYTTSPAAEVFYSEGALTAPPTGAVIARDTAFLQIEGIGILRGTENEELAQAFIDFVMGVAFQEDFPTRMWVYPANRNATPPVIFSFAPVPEHPAVIAPQDIADNRERWLDEWTKLVRS